MFSEKFIIPSAGDRRDREDRSCRPGRGPGSLLPSESDRSGCGGSAGTHRKEKAIRLPVFKIRAEMEDEYKQDSNDDQNDDGFTLF